MANQAKRSLPIWVQQTHHLALGDIKAKIVELGNKARHRHLALVILGQHVAAQLGPEVTGDPRRQRRHDRLALGRQPALAPEPNHVRAQDQVLHHVILVALEARTGRDPCPDHPLLVDHKPLELATAPARLAPLARAAARTRLLHAAGLELGPALEPLETRDLLAQGRVLHLQARDLLQQLEHQPLEAIQVQSLNIWGRPGHSRIQSQNPSIWESPNSKKFRPGFCPCYLKCL